MRNSSEGYVWDHDQPRQEILHRFPTIRTCCLADPTNRAAWWFEVNRDIEGWTMYLGTTTLHTRWHLDRAAVIAKLRGVVPKPDRAILKDFEERTSRVVGLKAGEAMARDEARRRAHAERESVEEMRARFRAEREAYLRGHAAPPMDAFTVLGLTAAATLDDVRKSHRRLAKLHHPDKGGDPAKFREVQAAYERLMADFERRATA